MAHFTYVLEKDSTSLYQGDLFYRTDDINEIIKKSHPQFNDDSNVYFALLTQTCDLVRRDEGNCKARQLTFAAVRELNTTMEAEVDKYKISKLQKKFNLLDDHSRKQIQQFVERLLNNNESGYFFYARDIDLGLKGDFCALLELTFTLDSKEYYDIFLKAKFMQLNDSFQHKLGYLIGNNFMRVGTEDWVPNHLNETQFEEKLTDLIGDNFVLVNKKILQVLKKQTSHLDVNEITDAEFENIQKIAEEEVNNQKEEVYSEIRATLLTFISDETQVSKIINKLKSNIKLKKQIKIILLILPMFIQLY